MTPWRRSDLLEKLTVLQLVKKFSALYATRRFIAMITRAHLSSVSEPHQKTPLTPIQFLQDPSAECTWSIVAVTTQLFASVRPLITG
jgi:hypothetical protein